MGLQALFFNYLLKFFLQSKTKFTSLPTESGASLQDQHTLPKWNILSQICSLLLFVCIGLPGPAHPPKVKYSLKAIFVACSLCSYVCIGLPRPTHPPTVKYSLKAIFVAYFLNSYVCIGLPGPAHPPKVKYSLKSCLPSLINLYVMHQLCHG